MQKVITINLNGNAYQIDESGHAALVAYLEGADRQLKENPDRAEIVADLEQAIADKCRGFLGPHKTVVSAAEVDQIIREMGPVDAAHGADAHTEAEGTNRRASSDGGSSAAAPRRLYLIHEGAMFAGVCSGLAAYLRIDATIVRIVFLILALVTKGGFGLAYLVLAFVIPSADTSEERAAAHGQPFNAQELIDRAKQNYANFAGRHDWGRQWRREHRAWRRQWRAVRWQPHWAWGAGWGNPPPATPGGRQPDVHRPDGADSQHSQRAVLWFWAWAITRSSPRATSSGQPLPDDVPLGRDPSRFWWCSTTRSPGRCSLHGSAQRTHSLGGQHHGLIAAWFRLMSVALRDFWLIVAGVTHPSPGDRWSLPTYGAVLVEDLF